MQTANANHLTPNNSDQRDKLRLRNFLNMKSGKSQPLVCAEDLSIPSFQVIVMNANMGCGSCRDKVYKILSKMTGFKEYSVDVRNKQVIIKGDVRFLWSTKEEAT